MSKPPILPAVSDSKFVNYKNQLVTEKISLWLGSQPIKILDVGCGNGKIDQLLTMNKNYNITAVDLNSQLLPKIRPNDGLTNLRFLPANVFHLPFPNETFDVVLSLGHSPAAALPGALWEIKRVLKKEGRVVMDYINHCSFYMLPDILVPSHWAKYFSMLKNSFRPNLEIRSLDKNRVNYHWSWLNLKSYLRLYQLSIHRHDYLYSLPSFLTSRDLIRFDNSLSTHLGLLLSRAILLELKNL